MCFAVRRLSMRPRLMGFRSTISGISMGHCVCREPVYHALWQVYLGFKLTAHKHLLCLVSKRVSSRAPVSAQLSSSTRNRHSIVSTASWSPHTSEFAWRPGHPPACSGLLGFEDPHTWHSQLLKQLPNAYLSHTQTSSTILVTLRKVWAVTNCMALRHARVSVSALPR